jgi:hypothetical protein
LELEKDWADKFRQLNVELVPPDETIRAVIQALPTGEMWRRGSRYRLPLGRRRRIALEGTAATWPHHFASDASDPDRWSSKTDWFFWVVISDRQLHVFEGHWGRGLLKTNPTAGPEAAHFPLDQIDGIGFNQGMVSQLVIAFKDGSSIELEAPLQRFDAFREAVRPFEQAGVTPRKMSFMPASASWALAAAFFIGGFAASIGAPADARTAQRLESVGVHTAATITDRRTDRSGAASFAKLDVAYQDDAGSSYEESLDYCGSLADLPVGETIEIVYDPDDPKVFHYADCNYPAHETIAFVAGLLALILGTFLVLRAWRFSGWKLRRWVGIPLVILGFLFAATSFTDDCGCAELIYTGGALMLIGLVAQFGRQNRAHDDRAALQQT